jgi:hypothetical protein
MRLIDTSCVVYNFLVISGQHSFELLIKENYFILVNLRGHAVAQLVEVLQAGRSRVRFPSVSLEFFIEFPSATLSPWRQLSL